MPSNTTSTTQPQGGRVVVVGHAFMAPREDSAGSPPPGPSPRGPTPPGRVAHAPSGVDMRSHVGLRGACAAWVVLFHCLSSSSYQLNFEGSTLMPLFMLLSGFSITVTYGHTQWKRARGLCRGGEAASTKEPQQQQHAASEAAEPPFPARTFWRNRVARVMSVYLLSILLAAPLWRLGFTPWVADRNRFIFFLAFSVVPLSSLVSFPNINPPGWFVTTVAFFWLWFPCILPRVQGLSDEQLVRWIARCFLLQLAVIAVLFPLMLPALGYWVPFGFTTTNPVTRIPIFLMGVCAGELALRHPPPPPPPPQGDASSNSAKADGASYLPWPRSFMGFWPLLPPACKGAALPGHEQQRTDPGDLEMQQDGAVGEGGAAAAAAAAAAMQKKQQQTHKPQQHHKLEQPQQQPPAPTPSCCGPLGQPPPSTWSGWSRMATTQSLGLLGATLCVGFAQLAVTLVHGNGDTIFGEVWLQALVPMAQLNVLVALTRDGGLSWASRALRTPLAQWLGERSLTVYLLHYPLIYYLAFLLNGARPNVYTCGPGELKDDCYARYLAKTRIPLWGTPVIIAATLLLAEVVYRVVEAPARRGLRKA